MIDALLTLLPTPIIFPPTTVVAPSSPAIACGVDSVSGESPPEVPCPAVCPCVFAAPVFPPFPNDELPNDELPNEEFPNDEFPDEELPNDELPNEELFPVCVCPPPNNDPNPPLLPVLDVPVTCPSGPSVRFFRLPINCPFGPT